jgi:peptide/nickel transport system substrate-binding protein
MEGSEECPLIVWRFILRVYTFSKSDLEETEMVRPRKGPRAAIVALLIAAGLTVGLIPGSRWGWAAPSTRTLVWGRSGDAVSLDNAIAEDGETGEATVQLFNLLVRAKPGATDVEPDLATSWSTSPDGLIWTFKLRKGVKFQDGTPWNAQAAKFNFDRWADAKNPYHQPGVDFIIWGEFLADVFKEAKVFDPETLQIILKTPNAPLLYNLTITGFEFGSPTAIAKYGGQAFSQHPVGTGAFKAVEWVRDDHITMVANPSYFRQGLPKVQRLIYRVIKDNAARYLALKAGEIQAMELPNPDDVKAAQADPNLKVGLRPALNSSWLRFNMNLPLFKDRRIREALALGIDRKSIVDALYGGRGEVANQLLPPVMWGRSTTVKAYPYDPDRAKALLAEAGYPNGFSLDLWYMPISRPYFPVPKEIGSAMASDLAKIGVRAHLMTQDWAAYLKDLRTNKYMLFMEGGIGDNGDPDDFYSTFVPKYDPNVAYLSYNNPTVFSLVNKARIVTDQAERARMYAQIADILVRDVRDIPVGNAKTPILMRRNVEGLVPQPNGSEYMETVELK